MSRRWCYYGVTCLPEEGKKLCWCVYIGGLCARSSRGVSGKGRRGQPFDVMQSLVRGWWQAAGQVCMSAHWMFFCLPKNQHVAFAQALDVPWECKLSRGCPLNRDAHFLISLVPWKHTEILSANCFGAHPLHTQVSWSRSIQSRQSSLNKLSQHMPSLKTCFWLVPCMPAQALGSVHGHNFALTPVSNQKVATWHRLLPWTTNMIQVTWPNRSNGRWERRDARKGGGDGKLQIPLPFWKSWFFLRGDSGAPWCWRSICPCLPQWFLMKNDGKWGFVSGENDDPIYCFLGERFMIRRWGSWES